MTTTKKPKHHHGNLREALIEAGFALMNEGGIDALTLRKCAARAGVSHAAPAHHFNGLISLKAAIIARGYLLFADEMRAAMAQAEPDPMAQLVAICQGYIAFARAHAVVFKFMFQPHDIDPARINKPVMEELARTSYSAFAILEQVCARFEPIPEANQGVEALIWSMVHGYAMLFCAPGADVPINPLPDFERLLSALNLAPRS